MPEFPGPLSYGIDKEATAHYAFEVRRMQYWGPRRKRGRMEYRVLFTLIPPVGEDGETVIHILRIVHGARPLAPAEAEG